MNNENICPSCGRENEKKGNFCSYCGNKMEQKTCEKCGVPIYGEGYLCDSCREKDNRRIAIISTVTFAIMYAILFFLGRGLSEFGDAITMSAEKSSEFENFISGAQFAMVCSCAPFIGSINCAKRANMKGLFYFDLVFLIVHVLSLFI